MPLQTIDASKQSSDRYGITRQVISDYSVSPDLPGATLIPSHRGNHGAQHGKRKPIPMVIDPEYYGDSVIITAAALDANRAMLSGKEEPSDIYKAITEAAKPKTEVIDPMAKKKQTEIDVAADKPSPRRRRAKKPAAAPVAPPQEPAVAPSEPPTPSAEVPPVTMEALQGLLGNFANGIKVDLADMQEQIMGLGDELDEAKAQAAAVQAAPVVGVPPQAPPILDEVYPEPEAVAAPQADAVAEEVPIPRVSVTLTFPNSNFEITSKYHSVIHNGSTLVLVYNSKYDVGDRVAPAVDLEHPYKIMAIQRDGTPAIRCEGMYMGQKFSHGDYDYTLFAVVLDAGEPDA